MNNEYDDDRSFFVTLPENCEKHNQDISVRESPESVLVEEFIIQTNSDQIVHQSFEPVTLQPQINVPKQKKSITTSAQKSLLELAEKEHSVKMKIFQSQLDTQLVKQANAKKKADNLDLKLQYWTSRVNLTF